MLYTSLLCLALVATYAIKQLKAELISNA